MRTYNPLHRAGHAGHGSVFGGTCFGLGARREGLLLEYFSLGN